MNTFRPPLPTTPHLEKSHHGIYDASNLILIQHPKSTWFLQMIIPLPKPVDVKAVEHVASLAGGLAPHLIIIIIDINIIIIL